MHNMVTKPRFLTLHRNGRRYFVPCRLPDLRTESNKTREEILNTYRALIAKPSADRRRKLDRMANRLNKLTYELEQRVNKYT